MIVLGVISDHRALKSKSPAMHMAVLEKSGLAGVYAPFVVKPDRVGEAVCGLRALGLAGANVTVPYKEQVIPFLNKLNREAAAVGAVNTIVVKPEGLIGYNTDTDGFSAALEQGGFSAAGRPVVVFGNGGAAKAVLYALTQAGAEEVVVVGRNLDRAVMAARPFGALAVTWTEFVQAPSRAHLAVNATSASAPEESPDLADLVGRIRFPQGRWLMDLNYGRSKNMWRDLAERQGMSFMDGLSMLAHQARLSFELWTGRRVEAALFLEALGVDV